MYLAMFWDDYDDNGPRSEDRELMSDSTVENLILNLLEWLADSERSYEEVISAWRTSCPRLPVWEDANERGLVTVVEVNGRSVVRITRLGLALLDRPIQEPLSGHRA
jgi:D-3-phosphoglycerate dehydrogenase